MKKASTIMSIALAFALVATAAFAAGESDSDEAAAAEQEMVLDPSTGEMISAPQYGGQIVIADTLEPPHVDTVFGGQAWRNIDLVAEMLSHVDWSIPRDKWGFYETFDPPLELFIPHLAESYEMPDPLTIVINLRQGIPWQNKAPMNGRELVADDVVFNYHRVTGLGSGFTEPSVAGATLAELPIESITAPDKYTVVFKMNAVHHFALDRIFKGHPDAAWIYPPEVIREHGDAKDWRNMVGTGPYLLTDWVDGSSITYTKNPDYWAFDEKFPENRLPYADEIRKLFMQDFATQTAALRTGKISLLRDLGKDQAESLQRTNPELVMQNTLDIDSSGGYGMNINHPPFDDVRVRRAMQLALDLEALNDSLYGGLGLTTPSGLVGKAFPGFFVPYAEWPDQLQADYGYDPERAEKLLDEAGYPRGSDGVRFTTPLHTFEHAATDLEYTQAAVSYWEQIGVDVEINVQDIGTNLANINAPYLGRYEFWGNGHRRQPPRLRKNPWSLDRNLELLRHRGP